MELERARSILMQQAAILARSGRGEQATSMMEAIDALTKEQKLNSTPNAIRCTDKIRDYVYKSEGLLKTKRLLEYLIYERRQSSKYQSYGLNPYRKIHLSGDEGKATFARILAGELGLPLFTSLSDLHHNHGVFLVCDHPDVIKHAEVRGFVISYGSYKEEAFEIKHEIASPMIEDLNEFVKQRFGFSSSVSIRSNFRMVRRICEHLKKMELLDNTSITPQLVERHVESLRWNGGFNPVSITP